MKLLNLSKLIVATFEDNMPIPIHKSDWKDDAEIIALYLAALKVIERFD